MTLQTLMAQAPQIISVIANVALGLVIIGTVVTKALGKSFPWIDSSETKLVAVLRWLPQIGVHPETQALETAYDQLKAQVAVETALANVVNAKTAA